jgi:outer membrane protein TolC
MNHVLIKIILIFLPGISLCDEIPINLRQAILTTLSYQKEIEVSLLDIDKQEGVLQERAGPFDPLIDQSLTDSYDRFDQKPPTTRFDGHDAFWTGSFRKLTRPGTAFSIVSQVEDFTSKRAGTAYAQQIIFQVTQPLLRNFLNSLTRELEEAALHELNAVQWDTLQSISGNILDTVLNYWEVAASHQNILIIEESISRIEKIIEMTRKLIKGEEIAAADINQPLAILAGQRQLLINELGLLYVNKQQLLFSMGLINTEAKEFKDPRIIVNEPVPRFNDSMEWLQTQKDSLVKLGLDLRFDIQASLNRELSTSSLLTGAQNQTLPQLDFFGQVTINRAHTNNALVASYLKNSFYQPAQINPKSPFYGRNNAYDYAMGVQLSIPIFNDQAIGYKRQQEANVSQTNLRTILIKQSTITQILQTINTQMALLGQLKEADEVVKKNEVNLENESRKLVNGFGNIFFLLDFETRLANAKMVQTDLAKQYAQGIARIRYLTSTLIETNDCNGKILFNDPVTYPKT